MDMDTLMAARFPFLEDASEMASQNSADIEQLLTSMSFEESRKRGVERLEDTIKNSEVSYTPLMSEYDRLIEVMSYPYARMIVSCINDRFLTKRYALSEAVRMNTLLGQEHQSTVNTVAKALGVNSDFDDDGLKMHFSDYLKFSTRIKSPEWKLVLKATMSPRNSWTKQAPTPCSRPSTKAAPRFAPSTATRMRPTAASWWVS